MSRKSVRRATATFLTAPQIPGVGTVFPAPPKISRTADALAGLPPGTPSGSVIYVEILQSAERRVALGGPTAGKKIVEHDLRLHLLFRSRQAHTEDAVDDHDDQVEAILNRVRTDRTLGTAGAQAQILEAGEGDKGITVATGMPKTIGTGSTIIWSLIDLTAREFITA